MINRFHWKNQIRYNTTTLTPSSENPQFPADNLLDQLRQKPWRTALGWTIVAGFNDRIDFDRIGSGPFVATIAAGTYATGAALATAATTAMNTADPGHPSYLVDYGVVSTGRFRIRDNAGGPLNFVLLWASGANTARSPCRDLGFRMAGAAPADSANVSSHTAVQAVTQSRHFLVADTGPEGANEGVDAITLLAHNLSTEDGNSHEVLIQAENTDTWTAPSYESDELTTGIGKGDSLRHMYTDPGSGVQTFIFWRLVIDDCSGPAGFFELGLFYLGLWNDNGVTDLSFCCADSLELAQDDYTVLQAGPSGTNFQTEEPSAETFNLEWLNIAEGSTNEDVLDAFNEDNPVGRGFFFTFDIDDPTQMVYAHKTAGRVRSFVPVGYFTHRFAFRESF